MNIRTQRLESLKQLLQNKVVGSQEELLLVLSKKGFTLTQATLSRDLRKLHAAKVSTPNGYIYVLPDHPEYKRITKNVQLPDTPLPYGFKKITFSHNLAVITTRTGYANGLAFDIDAHLFHSIIGTVAGDDTILLIMAEDATQEEVKKELGKIIQNFDNKK